MKNLRFASALTVVLVTSGLAGSFAACSSHDEPSGAAASTATGAGGSTGEGGATSAGGTGGGTAIDATTFCASYAKATCAATDGCMCPAKAGEPSCEERNTAQCELGLAKLIAGITLGDLEFDATVAGECIEAAAATLASCELPTSRNRPKACEGFLRDKAALGATCSKFGPNLLCGDGAGVCSPEGGKCLALPKADAMCVVGRCGDGLVCDGGICRALQGEGKACLGDDVCEKAFVCREGFCKKPGQKDEACSTAAQCAVGLGCFSGACATANALGDGCNFDECGPDATCAQTPGLKKCVAKAKVGEACSQFGDCEAGTDCDYAQMSPKCVAIPKIGETCAIGYCAEGASCKDGSCVATPKVGETCATGSSKPCIDGTGCVGSKCAAGAPAGQACVGDEGACAAGHVCDYAKMPAQCVALGDVGAACDNSDTRCKAGLHCDTAKNACAKPVALGEPCTSPLACETGNYCEFGQNGGTCAKLPSMKDESCMVECGGGLRCVGPLGLCAKGACVIR
ncbi:MAG: hypothetical protein FJ096_04165 [Deltaproteobacteria bacterium]|nr:hypothetical protein [Deltaproteobacteria bacterium]